MTRFSIKTLAHALYEGFPNLHNLAEEMARQHGKAKALSYYSLMGDNVRTFWEDIARQIIEHSSEWEENEGSCCMLSEKERARLSQLRAARQKRA